MQHDSTTASPRRYLFSENGETTFYDGVAIDRTDSFAAHDAGELARHWADLPEKLEGHFVAARVRTSPATIELMTDLLGVQQVYYCRSGNMWLISNSARPLVQLSDASQFDPLGVSM